MVKRPTQTATEPPYREFRDAMQKWIFDYRRDLHDQSYQFYQRVAAEKMGINVTSFSKMTRGRDIPTPRQALRIAHFFDIDVQEVLAAAGHPDVKRLIQAVASDATVGDKQYILGWLEAALSPQWQALDWRRSAYKEQADKILTLDLDAAEKARWYADEVYHWAIDPQRNLMRADRTTYDQVAIVS